MPRMLDPLRCEQAPLPWGPILESRRKLGPATYVFQKKEGVHQCDFFKFQRPPTWGIAELLMDSGVILKTGGLSWT